VYLFFLYFRDINAVIFSCVAFGTIMKPGIKITVDFARLRKVQLLTQIAQWFSKNFTIIRMYLIHRKKQNEKLLYLGKNGIIVPVITSYDPFHQKWR